MEDDEKYLKEDVTEENKNNLKASKKKDDNIKKNSEVFKINEDNSKSKQTKD